MKTDKQKAYNKVYTTKMMHQLRSIGLCINCRRPRGDFCSAWRCSHGNAINTEWTRRKRGGNRWRPGSRGRRPIGR